MASCIRHTIGLSHRLNSTSHPILSSTRLYLKRSLCASALLCSQEGGEKVGLRPPSAQIFTQDQVSAGIAALSEAGYDASTVWEQRVVWGDHDQFQHVNNVHFVRWFESARMFFANKLTQADAFTDKRRHEINRVTKETETERRVQQPTHTPPPPTFTSTSFIHSHSSFHAKLDTVQILVGQACQLPLGKDRFMLRGACYSLAQKTIVAVSAQDCVTYDYTKLQKCDIPHDIRQALQAKGSHFDKKL
ncbi:uncharacterized protein UTRI_00795 [Ustilago trichophora]|uniref:Thioesterase/thiol ester dehydrase-isomerase n=1 Tax=Ustilago trichophora TaxID=86804 RepID=A0A5C3DSN1_9BASI|nr:uncharacterized protein UTRI_00795 [Ustilago trichophora]